MHKRHVIPALLVGVIAVASWLAVLRATGSDHARSVAVPKASGPAVPAAAALVRHADLPVFLTGLGTVGAFNSVLVGSRVLLPIAGVPQVDIPTVQITVGLPGASAETMATSVAAPRSSGSWR